MNHESEEKNLGDISPEFARAQKEMNEAFEHFAGSGSDSDASFESVSKLTLEVRDPAVLEQYLVHNQHMSNTAKEYLKAVIEFERIKKEQGINQQ